MLDEEPLPRVSQVIKRNKLIPQIQKKASPIEEEFVIVSVFGGTNNIYTSQESDKSNFKQPFRLILDAFGVPNFDEIAKNENPSPVSETRLEAEIPEVAAHASSLLELLSDLKITEFSPEVASVDNQENGRSKVQDGFPESTDSKTCSIDGFYNEDESILFLHLEGAYDPQFVLEACEELQLTLSDPGFIPKWSSLKSKYCQSLLLLFTLSHIMILSNEEGYFDTNYIQLFRAVDAVRILAKPFINYLLNELDGLPKNWVEQGRLCSPRLIFFFEVESPVPPSKLMKVCKSESLETLKAIEKKTRADDIYQVLRKCRIITNNSIHALFTLNRTQGFVYLHEKSVLESDSVDNEQLFNQSILQFCKMFNTNPPPERTKETPTHYLVTPSNPNVFLSSHEMTEDRSIISDFQEFIMAHIKSIRQMDDHKRNGEQKTFLVRPTWKEWTEAYTKLYAYLILGEHEDSKAKEPIVQLEKYCNVDADYLENQCSSMFSKIYGIYMKNIPEFFVENEHRSRFKQAANAFFNISRSAGVLPWLEKLALKCERYWKNGHQQCEARSLHEHPCINRLHRVSARDHLEVIPFPDMDDSLPEFTHNTGNRITSYCSCGKKSSTRDEPFTIREANYDFYRRIGKNCCEILDGWDFPVFIPAIDGKQELSLKEMLVIIQNKKSRAGNEHVLSDQDLDILENENASQAVEIELRQENEMDDDEESTSDSDGDNNGSGSIGNESERISQTEKAEIPCENEYLDDQGHDDGEGIVANAQLSQEIVGKIQSNISALEIASEILSVSPGNQTPEVPEPRARLNMHRSRIPYGVGASAIEYLPGMLHSKSPPGLLPIFPSWSLLCLGYSRIYSHNTGIVHQPGFLAGSNFLLPWDVKVKAADGVGVTRPHPRHYRGRPSLRKMTDEFSVKVFIGLEYECKRGHRFFIESPDKVLFHLNPSENLSKKEAAVKLATTDMPLYVKCPCNPRDGRDSVAQLLRVHIVTPKAPVHVILNPRVQPGPNPCPLFVPGNEEIIKLIPSSYWILRLPYSYVGDDRVYVPPQDETSYNGKLMRGLCKVVAMDAAETKTWKEENALT